MSQTNLQRLTAVLGLSNAITVDHGALLSEWELSPANGELDNQVLRCTWVDDEGSLYADALTEAGIAGGTFHEDGRFVASNAEGDKTVLQFFKLQQLNDSPLVFNSIQKHVLGNYAGGELAHLASQVDLDHAGDGLLRYLMVELSEKEGCDSEVEGIRRLNSIITQLQDVVASLAPDLPTFTAPPLAVEQMEAEIGSRGYHIAQSDMGGYYFEVEGEGSEDHPVREGAVLAAYQHWQEARSTPGVKAEAWSDDGVVKVIFNAALWLNQASDEDILNLARIGWGRDFQADRVAEYFSHVPEMKVLFDYLACLQRTDKDCGFECHVDQGTAVAWLGEHRPSLVVELDAAGLI